MFNKKWIHALITQGHNNHMTPMTSNPGGHENNREESTVDKEGFQMAPIYLSIFIGYI